MTAAQHQLQNLTALIDRNRLKAMDATDTAKPMEPMAERWRTFGWRVREIDGHDMAAICEALDWGGASDGPPSLIIAHTIKGKGISFIENDPAYHNAVLTEEQIVAARAAQEHLRQQLCQEAA